MDPVEARIYAEFCAGGFGRCDHRMEYVVRVNSLLRNDSVVLDYGAGRGKWQFDPVPLRRSLGDWRNRGARVVACDVDAAVLDNPQADERHVFSPGGKLPFADASFDLITAFSVFEHVEDAVGTARELARVLKPGGWLCGWTPNKWGYVGIAARLIPKRLHGMVLRLVEPRRAEEDSFPPLYRMNTRRALRRLFPEEHFRHCTYPYDGQPFYHLEQTWMAQLWRLIFVLTPAPWKGFYMVFIQKL